MKNEENVNRPPDRSHEPARILITGASRGLGRALAKELASRGAAVALVARSSEALAELEAEIEAAGGSACAIAADLVEADPARLLGEAEARLGPIDALLNVAGSLGPVPLRPLSETTPEAMLEAFEVNVLAPFRLSRAALGAMRARGRGLVLFVSSDAAVEAYPTWGAYGASKAALEHLARTWAAEIDEPGVRLVVVDPGEMDTRMHADAMPDADRASLPLPEVVARALARELFDPERIPHGHRLVLEADEGAGS